MKRLDGNTPYERLCRPRTAIRLLGLLAATVLAYAWLRAVRRLQV